MTYVQELEVRSFEVRAVNEETRTISGMAVPYGQVTSVGDFKEKFERGAFGDIENVKLMYGHSDAPIGLVTKGDDTEDGFLIEARISDTARGNEIYTLLKDGVLNRFSVGFVPVEDSTDDDGVVIRTKATLKEVSVVPFPAYDGAQILAVRDDSSNDENTNERGHIENNMTTENTFATVADLTDVRDAVDEMERRLAAGIESNTDAAPQFRSAGEFIKALADGDDAAKNEVRAFIGANGGTLSDSVVRNDWKATLLNIVNGGRPVMNLFSRGPLGPEGMTVEYPRISALTGDVAQQANEADNLAYLEVAVTTATAPVRTYGGYSELSRQVIERSSVSHLDAVLRFQAASYAKVTNAAVLATLTGATPQTGTSFGLGAATASSFLSAVLDGVQKINDNGQGAQADAVLVSTDVYSKLANLVDSAGRPLFDINGDGSNTFGNVNVRGIAGSLAGLPVVVVPGLAVRTMYIASSTAVTAWENPGAPIRLQDENIINLTKQFSLYGYLASGVTNANGLVKPTIAV